MKKLIMIAGLTLLASTAFAHHKHFGDNPDMYGSPLLEHGPGAPTGTPMKGEGDLYGSLIANPEDLESDPNAKPEPYDRKTAWKSEGDLYQSVIFDGSK